MLQNLLFKPFPAEVQEEVNVHLKAIAAAIKPYVHTLEDDQRKEMLKIGDRSEIFVKKSIEFCKSNPEFLPSYFKAEDMETDFDNYTAFKPLLRALLQQADNVGDTALVCGSEAYQAALVYYGSVRQAAERGILGAQSVYEELKKHFPGRRQTQETKAGGEATVK